MNEPLRRIVQVALPLAVVAVGVAASVSLARSREELPTVTPPRAVAVVQVTRAAPSTWRAHVRTNGTVQPANRSDLVAEVAGRVLSIGPTLAEGAFFTAGDVLVQVDARDYELARVEAEAEVAQARLRLELEQAEAESARREWEAMQRTEQPSPLVLREPQLTEARARVAAAEARLEAAERDVERCVVRAPYDGRVLSKSVDLGQFVARNARLAQIYATDAAEVRLPVPDAELAFLDLEVRRTEAGTLAEAAGPAVELRADFGGRSCAWHGRIVRTEGQLDPRSRMLHMIARVEAPYATGTPGDAPLMVNLFVDAEILGPEFDGVFVLPRTALRGDSTILVVDGESRLRHREVQILRRERDTVVLRAGVAAGDLVCVTPLEVVTEGMEVRVDGSADAPGAEAGR